MGLLLDHYNILIQAKVPLKLIVSELGLGWNYSETCDLRTPMGLQKEVLDDWWSFIWGMNV